LLDGRPLLVCASASRTPARYVQLYQAAFGGLGVEVRPLSPGSAAAVASGAGGVFFSGGSQSRLAEAVRGTDAETAVQTIREAGGVIAGTSAGASVMSDTMLARGPADATPGSETIRFGDGLGLIAGVLIDQHFAERGRIGRLVAAVGARPDLIGIGIDEDTAAIVQGDALRVIGSGAVYLLRADGGAPADGFRLNVLAAADTPLGAALPGVEPKR
jgi:cyanophycinase